jgi:hypothetical protein
VVQNISAAEKDTLVQAPLATAADVASSYVDMANFDNVTFRGIIGTVGSTSSVTLAAWGSSSTSSTGAAISGASITSTASNSDKGMKLEVSRPRQRYVKTHLTSNGTTVEYGGTFASQGSGRVEPVTDDATTMLTRVLTVPQTT